MILHSITIKQFRNYDTLHINLSPRINIVYGNNAQGKTNLLESIYVLGLTKSHRSFIDHNLIKKNYEFAKIAGILYENEIPTQLQITIGTKNKKLEIDKNIKKKVSDYVSKMNIIIFYPEDLDLIKGTPAVRRRFLNLELSQLYSNYLTILMDYERLLKMRNECLKSMNRHEFIDSEYFRILTGYFVDKAVLIYRMRSKFIEKLNNYVGDTFEKLTGVKEFHIIYRTIPEFSNFDTEKMKKVLYEKLDQLATAEIRLGSGLIGPQRDDLEFLLGDSNLRMYGSQGQQRLSVLALKLSEIELFRQYCQTNPILLLDDVFSELDDEKKNNLLYYIDTNIQTIITTTDLKNIRSDILEQANLIKIENGMVINEGEENNGEK